MATATLWQFVVHRKNGAGETWTWRRSRRDGRPLEVSSDAHPTYGKAINDAIKHGFQPREDSWLVVDSASVTHFEPYRGTRASRKPKKTAPAARTRKKQSRGPFAGNEP